jgi:hypothetical protein
MIHEYKIRHASAASPGAPTDSEGRPIRVTTETTVAHGRINMLSARERLAFGQQGEDADMSALAPLGTDVWDGDQVIVENLRPHLNGVWEVSSVRDAVIHLRILCRRRNR